MLSLRAVYLNGLWAQFIAYRVATEQLGPIWQRHTACNGCVELASETMAS